LIELNFADMILTLFISSPSSCRTTHTNAVTAREDATTRRRLLEGFLLKVSFLEASLEGFLEGLSVNDLLGLGLLLY